MRKKKQESKGKSIGQNILKISELRSFCWKTEKKQSKKKSVRFALLHPFFYHPIQCENILYDGNLAKLAESFFFFSSSPLTAKGM